jgi:hypothetical protein
MLLPADVMGQLELNYVACEALQTTNQRVIFTQQKQI